MNELILRNYPNQHYKVYFNLKTGFFARIEDEGYQEPFWSEDGPEFLDISITNQCNNYCKYCYRNSDLSGKVMSLKDYIKIMEDASRIGVLQVALGGGNPNEHPNFLEILRVTREEYGIVPNFTTNGIGLTDKIIDYSNQYCGAVAISAYAPYSDMLNAKELLIKNNVKTNIHFLLNIDTIETAKKWLINPEHFLEGVNAIVFLNYKPVGRNKNSHLTLNYYKNIEEFFSLITSCKYSFKIGFDSCCIAGVVNYLDYDERFIEKCEAGRFSAFISEEMKMYPCSFMIDHLRGEDINNHTIKEIWKHSTSFINLRNKIDNPNSHCIDCKRMKLCGGGCPIFDINCCNTLPQK